MVNSGNSTKSAASALGAPGRVQDFRLVAGEVADGGVDLRQGDFHVLVIEKVSRAMGRRRVIAAQDAWNTSGFQ